MKPLIPIESGVKLIGGFCNMLPPVGETAATVALRARRENYMFDGSHAAARIHLRQLCAPSIFTYAPKGFHIIRATGSKSPVSIWWKEPQAKVMARQLDDMRARAARREAYDPHLDYDHDGGYAGDPLSIFWDTRHGIRCHVKWAPEAEEAIISGRCNSFSPHWVNDSKGEFLGLKCNIGGLLSRTSKPAFGHSMPPIRPITKLQRMEQEANLFLRRVDALATDYKALDKEFPVLRAHEVVARENPELFNSWELRETLDAELLADIRAAHA